MPHRAIRIVFALMLLSLSARAAVPAFTDFFGTNGIVIRTNGPQGHQTVQVDGVNLQPAAENLTNWSLISTNILGSIGSSATPSFGQLTSSGLTQSHSAGSGTNSVWYASILVSSNVGTYPSGNGTFPYSGLYVTNSGYYAFFGGAYLASTTTVNLILFTNDTVDTRFTAQSFPVTEGKTGVSPVDLSGISYFSAGDIIGFVASTVPAAPVSVSYAHIGMLKIDVIGGGGSGGGSGEANYNASASTTNSTRFSIDYGRLGATATNLLRTVEAGANIIITNQGTNLIIASTSSGSSSPSFDSDITPTFDAN